MLGLLRCQGEKTRRVVEIRQAENTWSIDNSSDLDGLLPSSSTRALSRSNRFWIAPEFLLQIQREARERSLDIIGIYHSHPDHPAIPSDCDRAYAWSGYSYVIIAVDRGVAQAWKSWSLDAEQTFQPEAIAIVDPVLCEGVEAIPP